MCSTEIVGAARPACRRLSIALVPRSSRPLASWTVPHWRAGCLQTRWRRRDPSPSSTPWCIDASRSGSGRPPARAWPSPTCRFSMRAAMRTIFIAWSWPRARRRNMLDRLLVRGLSEHDAGLRIAAQLPIEEKRRKADYVIDTSGTEADTDRRVIEVWKRLEQTRRILNSEFRRPNYQCPSLHQSCWNLRFRVARRCNPLFDERVPFVTMRALPEQLGAAVPAAHADVRVEIEDRPARQVDIPRDQRAGQAKDGQRVPDGLMDGQGMRVVLEGLEQQLQGGGGLSGG